MVLYYLGFDNTIIFSGTQSESAKAYIATSTQESKEDYFHADVSGGTTVTYASKGDHFYIDEFPKKHWRVTKNAGDNTTITCDDSVVNGGSLSITMKFSTGIFEKDKYGYYTIKVGDTVICDNIKTKKIGWNASVSAAKQIDNVTELIVITTS